MLIYMEEFFFNMFVLLATIFQSCISGMRERKIVQIHPLLEEADRIWETWPEYAPQVCCTPKYREKTFKCTHRGHQQPHPMKGPQKQLC